MASEIRVNTINNSSGLGTITISDTGAVFAGVTTITSLQVTGTLIGVANTDNIRTNTNATFLQNVNVSGAVTSTGMIVTGVTTVAAGSTSAPSISPSGDSNTGIFFPSADTIAFGEGGVEAARIDSSGRFGIGTTTPGSFFSGANQLVVGSGSGAQGITIYSASNDNAQIFFSDGTAGDERYRGILRYDHSVDAMTFLTAGANERARIDSSGRLLVGTSSARTNAPGGTEGILLEGTSSTNSQNRFTQHVFGSSSTDGPYLGLAKTRSTSIGGNTVVQSGDELGGIYFQGADGSDFKQGASILSYVDATPGTNDMPGRLVFSTTADGASSPTERLRIDSSGNVGINETTPSNFNDAATGGVNFVLGATGSGRGVLTFAAEQTGGADEPLGIINFVDSDTTNASKRGARIIGHRGSDANSAYLKFETASSGNPTERMRITSGGDFYFNCTTTTKTTDGFRVEEGGVPNVARGNAGSFMKFFHSGSGSQIGSITNSGGAATAFNTSSDYRLKENIAAFPDGIARLQQLKPCRFNFITNPDDTVDGFIAHEVQAIVPEAITGEKDAVDEDGNPIYQGIDQSKLVPLLTAALQEAIGEIESLKARVAALEAN